MTEAVFLEEVGPADEVIFSHGCEEDALQFALKLQLGLWTRTG